MRIRISSRELCYPYDEFAALAADEICRRYGWGDVWLDRSRDRQADREVERASQT